MFICVALKPYNYRASICNQLILLIHVAPPFWWDTDLWLLSNYPVYDVCCVLILLTMSPRVTINTSATIRVASVTEWVSWPVHQSDVTDTV